MTFTYLGDLSTDLDTIRFKVGDTVSGSGIKPNGGNFTDEEINGLLTLEGNVNFTIGAIYKANANAWANYVDTRIGPRDEKLSQARDYWMKVSKKWDDENGTSSTSSVTVGTINFGIDEEDEDFDIT